MKETALLTVLMITLFLLGCASVGTKMDMSRMSEIKKGETTRAELVQMFGQPNTVGLNGDGQSTATWIYSEAKSHGTNFIPVVGAVAGRYDTRLQQLVVIFNEDDVVEDFTFTDNESQLKSGIL